MEAKYDFESVAGKPFDKLVFSKLMQNISTHGIIPIDLQITFLDFTLFMYYLSWSFVSILALAYYRKYKAN